MKIFKHNVRSDIYRPIPAKPKAGKTKKEASIDEAISNTWPKSPKKKKVKSVKAWAILKKGKIDADSIYRLHPVGNKKNLLSSVESILEVTITPRSKSK